MKHFNRFTNTKTPKSGKTTVPVPGSFPSDQSATGTNPRRVRLSADIDVRLYKLLNMYKVESGQYIYEIIENWILERCSNNTQTP